MRLRPCRRTFNHFLCRPVAGKLSGQWSPQQVARCSTKLCSFRRWVSLKKNCAPICAVAGSCLRAEPRQRQVRLEGESLALCLSGTDQQKARIAPVLATGTACCRVASDQKQLYRCARRAFFVMRVKGGGKDSDRVVSARIFRVQHLPQSVMASLTWDRRNGISLLPQIHPRDIRQRLLL